LHLLTRIVILRRRRFAGAERGSRLSQELLNPPCERVRSTEHASRGPFRPLERRYGQVEIDERGAGVVVDRHRVNHPGEEHETTLLTAKNYATSLCDLERFEEAKSLLRKTMPVARRVLGENDALTLGIRANYAGVLYLDPDATLDQLREAVTTLEDAARIARRVFGGPPHPITEGIEDDLRDARATLRFREMSPGSA
jgi:hypothetical protein